MMPATPFFFSPPSPCTSSPTKAKASRPYLASVHPEGRTRAAMLLAAEAEKKGKKGKRKKKKTNNGKRPSIFTLDCEPKKKKSSLALCRSLSLSVVLLGLFDTEIEMLQRLAATAARTALAAEQATASARIRSLGAIGEASAAACRQRRSSSSAAAASTSASSSFSSLPVIDVDALLSDASTREERLAAAEKLHRACKEVGFFYARAKGTTESSASAPLLARARRWFEETPLEKKREIALSAATGFRGWQPLHANVTRYEEEGEQGKKEGRKEGKGYVGDHHEAIDLYRGVTADDALPPSPIHAPPGTGFPTRSDPELSRGLEEHIAKCLKLGEGIMRGLALGLGLGDERFFERAENGGTTAESSYWVSRVIFYPPLLLEGEERKTTGDIPRSERLSCGEHTDYGWLTMIAATSEGDRASENALQVRDARGEWVSAPPLRDAFVCNVGDMLKIASGGLYSSTPHRVLHAAFTRRTRRSGGKGGGSEEGEEENEEPPPSLPPPRTSIAVFYEPHFNALIAPVVGGAKGGGGDVEAKRYGAHLEKKVFQNFEFEGV